MVCASPPHCLTRHRRDADLDAPTALEHHLDRVAVVGDRHAVHAQDHVRGAEPGSRGGNFVTGPDQQFLDVCCERGAAAAGVTFSDVPPPVPGDAELEPGVKYVATSVLATVVAASALFAEAAATAGHCATYCDLFARCAAFSYDAGGRVCTLFRAAPARIDATHSPRLALCGDEGAALFDQSYFGKLHIDGPRADAALQWACGNDMEGRPPGAVVYTPLCNARGGVEAERIRGLARAAKVV